MKGQTEVMLVGLLLAPVAVRRPSACCRACWRTRTCSSACGGSSPAWRRSQWVEGAAPSPCWSASPRCWEWPFRCSGRRGGGAGLGHRLLLPDSPADRPGALAGAGGRRRNRQAAPPAGAGRNPGAGRRGAVRRRGLRDQFEALFGYPALVAARTRLGEGAVGAGGSLRVRDRILEWIDRREQARREVSEQRGWRWPRRRPPPPPAPTSRRRRARNCRSGAALAMERIAAMAAAAAPAREAQLKAELDQQKGETERRPPPPRPSRPPRRPAAELAAAR